jgi:hypothetical protein
VLEENSVGDESVAFAKKLEGKVQKAMNTLERLRDVDWKKVTEFEKWSVGGRAHDIDEHVGSVRKTV